ncbi:phosphatidate cytidylyltransferase [Arachnia propionica]|uniref:Phosphatidate cytidylyltransferase n=1 Tax=Arachnia propionica TaxID=1750 RepID=A0A3P1TA63_9ACTN|nr:phosphatidate cytidylyltransferase [Arachnia propionica]MDO5082198.1 phosphatidate cytidylyltransferase [Arachnia propionica]RRD05746.1 phosphatidate cytidylyltransferase [Arachnia propionica]
MKESHDTTPTPRVGRNVPLAIGVGVALMAALAVGLLWVPWFFILLSALTLSLGVVEVHHALARKGMHSQVRVIVVGTAISVIGGYAVAELDLALAPTTVAMTCVAGTVLACLVARLLLGGVDGFIRDIAASALIIAWLPLMGIFVPLLMAPEDGRLRIITVVLCVSASDTGAYAVGSLFGRNRMAPGISPSKTWEGFAGSMFFAALIGTLCALFILGSPWWLGLVLGLAIAPAATLGDLVESLVKRDAGLKDMSSVLPGHGGVMDRLDSLLVAVPVGWLILHLGLGG